MTDLKKVNCIIIEDDEIDRQAILLKAGQYAFLNICGVFSNAIAALEKLRNTSHLLLMLDVDMPVLNGIELLELLGPQAPACILITSHPEYALQGYDHHVLDYLLKPVTAGRFDTAMKRAKEYFDTRGKALLYDIQFSNENIVIKDGYDIIRLNVGDIVYLEALKDYTKVITSAKTYMTSINLKESLEKLPDHRFLRIHRSYAVAVVQIKKMEQNELLLGQIRLPVGKTFKQDVSRFLKGNV